MKEKGPGRRILERWQWNTLVFSTLIKLSLAPSYHSTDFEVHRHWLALTKTLPLSQWYFDETSQWTLDYPPFFAYFSWLLGVPAKIWDPKIVDLNGGLDYSGWKCVLFMRVTVIATELVLASALFALSRQQTQQHSVSHKIPSVVAAAILLHPGLLIIDHIHFQYNGFLFGVLLWSIWAAREGRFLLCAFLFSSLLNLKHIYVYIAPAYFVFLLQSYVIKGDINNNSAVSHSGSSERLFTLAVITVLPFTISILPLAMSGLSSDAPAGPVGILSQMLSRLFPFSRGLNHAYWAANVWALYTFADRVLIRLLPPSSTAEDVGTSASRGIIGDTHFGILPQIGAGHCFLLTFIFTILFSIRLFFKPTQIGFLQSITLFGLTSFLFGFHVHEKAILLPLIPLTLLSSLNYFYTRMTLLLSMAGIVALFPLLYQVKETPIKIIYSLLWLTITFRALFAFHFRPTPSNVDLIIHTLENVYLAGFIPLQVFVSILHPIWTASGGSDSLAFQASSSAVSYVGGHAAAASASVGALTSVASTLASQASASLSSVMEGWATSSNIEPVNSTLTDYFGLAGEAISSEEKAIQDQVISAVVSVVEWTKDAVLEQKLLVNPIAESLPHTTTTMEFLPLMLTSVYCALGVTWVWLRLGYWFLVETATEEVSSQTQIKITASTPKKVR